MDGPLRIFIEPRGYGSRGPRYIVRLNKADGAVLIDATIEPMFDSARVLLSRGIVGWLEMWSSDRPYCRLRGDIAKMATRTVIEGQHQSPSLRRYVERPQDGRHQFPPSATRAKPNGRPCASAQVSA